MHAAALAQGKPGIFLRHLDTAFSQYQKEPEWGERNYDWYLGVFRGIYATYREKYRSAARLMEAAIKNGEWEIDIAGDNPFHSTVFDGEFVAQSYFRESSYMISALFYEVIKEGILEG